MSPGFLNDCGICLCGHMKDEHDKDDPLASPCKVKGCNCPDFEWNGEEEPE
jgi:hypothetical protein